MYNDFSRREALVNIGKAIILSTAGAGVLPPVLAQHVHEAVAETKSLDTKGNYQPKYLTGHEYKTLRNLADMIVPADSNSKGALDAGAPEFIDFLCSRNADLAEIFSGGLAWMDEEMRRRNQPPFVDASVQERTGLLDVLAYRKNETPANAPGIRFFNWARNMVIDAYYTSPVGMKDLGFMGNGAVAHFSVPQEAVDYAIRRSPFANEA
jgi:gluconate 2-dehydrogenase gamma chain